MGEPMQQTRQRVRVFVAIPLSLRLRQHLSDLVFTLKERVAPVRWVRLENYHLTLRFLGDIPETTLPPLCSALEAEDWPRGFTMSVGRIGGFPNLKRARVVCVRAHHEDLEVLRLRLDDVLSAQGFGRDARFSSHITLGRARGREGIELDEVARQFGPSRLEPEAVERMVLYRSELRPSGPVYHELASFSLGLPGQTSSCYT